MDRAWFASGVCASPVVEAEGEIALLLDFGEDDAGAESVDGAGWNEDAVTGVYFVDMEQVFEVTATEGLLEHIGGDTGLEAGADACSGFGVEDDPCFGFAIFDGVECFGLGVVGVYLEREPVVGIEEFDEQWELFDVLVFSEQFARVLLDDFGEWSACEGSIFNAAGAVGVIGDFPAFGVVGFGSELSSEE